MMCMDALTVLQARVLLLLERSVGGGVFFFGVAKGDDLRFTISHTAFYSFSHSHTYLS
jgi:hypothetical protein